MVIVDFLAMKVKKIQIGLRKPSGNFQPKTPLQIPVTYAHKSFYRTKDSDQYVPDLNPQVLCVVA
jgi:hypothetical protein